MVYFTLGVLPIELSGILTGLLMIAMLQIRDGVCHPCGKHILMMCVTVGEGWCVSPLGNWHANRLTDDCAASNQGWCVSPLGKAGTGVVCVTLREIY